jgi:hypothetical protein
MTPVTPKFTGGTLTTTAATASFENITATTTTNGIAIYTHG